MNRATEQEQKKDYPCKDDERKPGGRFAKQLAHGPSRTPVRQSNVRSGCKFRRVSLGVGQENARVRVHALARVLHFNDARRATLRA